MDTVIYFIGIVLLISIACKRIIDFGTSVLKFYTALVELATEIVELIKTAHK